MVKIVRILILTLLLAGCTSSQLRSMSRSLGIHKVARVFPVDLSSREKQVFRVRNLEKPSFWGRRFDGTNQVGVNLCVDSILDVSIQAFRDLDIDLKISMDGYSDNQVMHRIAVGPSSCWWMDDSDGVLLGSIDLPVNTDFNEPMIIEFQIKNRYGWTLIAKSHKPDPSGNTPLLEYEVVNGDTLALKKLVNPRLVIWTGN